MLILTVSSSPNARATRRASASVRSIYLCAFVKKVGNYIIAIS